jgi:DNA-binding response OmpR family regulator
VRRDTAGEAVMRRILVVDGDQPMSLAIQIWLKRSGFSVALAKRCLCKPFKPATLLRLIDECLSRAEPHRKCVATLSCVVEAVSGPRGNAAVLACR